MLYFYIMGFFCLVFFGKLGILALYKVFQKGQLVFVVLNQYT